MSNPEILDITIKISGVQTLEPTFYLGALMNHIKTMITSELNNAPDTVVDTYEKITVEAKVIE